MFTPFFISLHFCSDLVLKLFVLYCIVFTIKYLYFYGFIHSLTHSLQTSKNFCFYLFGTDNAVAQRESMCL